MSRKDNLDRIEEISWRTGFNNLLKIELSSWFKTRKWLKHILIWVVIINLILFATTLETGEEEIVEQVSTETNETNQTNQINEIDYLSCLIFSAAAKIDSTIFL